MFKRPLLTICLASIICTVTMLIGILTNENVQTSLFNKPVIISSGVRLMLASEDEGLGAKTGEWSYCDYVLPAEPIYNVEVDTVTVDADIEAGEVFMVDVIFKNTGNVRFFSADSGCTNGPILNLGTQKNQDRFSVLGKTDITISGWLNPGRIKMQDAYADPGQTFHITFQSLAPDGDNIYREFFQPVVENVAWIGSVFGVDIPVGAPTDEMKDAIQYVNDLSITASDLLGLERSVEVSLWNQTMYAKFGDLHVWSMKVSTGASDTPTPRGTYKVLSKQELRIGGKAPHYRMPYFQLWDSRGYGIHALPYLANDGGTFWTEANAHIGTPVSHGCIRVLPEDASTVYKFTDIGTPVVIH